MSKDFQQSYEGRFGVPLSVIPRSGFIDGFKHVRVIGHNPAVGTSEEGVWDGSAAFNYPSAAVAMNLSSSDAVDRGIALGTLTMSVNIADGETVTIGTKVYTFQDTLTDVDGNVHIGVASTNSLDNLIDAINLGAGAGTDYATSMTLNTDVSALAGAGDTMDITALVGGVEVATTETAANSAWGDPTTLMGTGIQSVQVYGLDENRDEVKEIVFLNGELEVATITTFIRVFEMHGLTAGSGGVNAGDVYVSTGGVTAGVPDVATQIWSKMLIGENHTQAGVFTIPNGWVGYLTLVWFNTATTGTQHISARLACRPIGGVFFTFGGRVFASREGGSVKIPLEDAALPVASGIDLELRGTASAATPELSGVLSLYLIKDPNINTE